MKKIIAYTLYTLLLNAIVCACSDDLDINQVYSYDLVYMPIQNKIVQNETVEIQCKLLKEGYYEQAEYTIRYFQSEGKGLLVLDDSVTIYPNEYYTLINDRFNLYYTSLCSEQQVFDIYIEDTFGQSIQKSFSFTNENAPEENPIDYSFTFTSLPVPSRILLNDTVEIRCLLTKVDGRNDATYAVRYFQPTGKGELILENGAHMLPNELYTLDNESFSLYYISNSEERQTIDLYIIDNHGKIVQKSFSFENISIEPEPEIDISFEFVTLPVSKKIASGETIEIRCQIKKADERNTSSYSIRYFQNDGKGQLRMDNGLIFSPNDLYPLNNSAFRLYYTSHCTVQQVLDVYVEDNFGQVVQKGTCCFYRLNMKYIITFFVVLTSLPVWGQPNRKPEIEALTEKIYSTREFRQIVDSLQLSFNELSDYPVIFPVKKPQRISSGFGMRKHPVYKTHCFHTGIDIVEVKGTPVYATGNGVVIRKGYNPGYGNFVEIKHAGGFHSFYAHLSKTLVNKGDSVCITQQIACVGSTGVSTGSHLHYEVRKGKRFLNPTEWCYCLYELFNL